MIEEELKRRLSLYHDGGLSEGERREIEDLIRTDPECEREARRIWRLSEVLRPAPLPELSAEARAGLHRRLDRFPENGLLPWAESLAFAAVVLLLLGTSLCLGTDATDRAAFAEMEDWEQIAVMPKPDPSYTVEPEIRLAQWVVGGLSVENGYE